MNHPIRVSCMITVKVFAGNGWPCLRAEASDDAVVRWLLDQILARLLNN